MKKIKSVAMILILSVVICGCKKGNSVNQKSVSLYDRGLEIISLMNEMVKSDQYVELLAINSLNNSVEQIKQGDYQTPKSVYKVILSKDMMDFFRNTGEDITSLEGLSDDLLKSLYQKLYQSISVQLNSKFGTEKLATSATFTASTFFVDNDVDENALYVYLFDNGFPVVVNFIVGEDHAIVATGYFVMDSEVKDTEEGIKDFFSSSIYVGNSIDQVEKVTREN